MSFYGRIKNQEKYNIDNLKKKDYSEDSIYNKF